MVFKFKPHQSVLDEFALGDRTLIDWPIVDTMPAELDRVDFADLLFGRDLLAPYQVSIDLSQRALLLYPTDGSAAEDTGSHEDTQSGEQP